jgi:hypothetical protein
MGKLFIYDQHPFTLMLPWDGSGTGQKLVLEHGYFSIENASSRHPQPSGRKVFS